MNKELRTRLAEKIAAVMVRRSAQDPKWTGYEIVDEIEQTMYELSGKRVPYDDYKKIWKYYNSEGGWTIRQLADRFGLSMQTVTDIVKDKYF
jgi:hypothetical protein